MQRNQIGLAVIGSGRIGTLRARLASGHPAVHFIATADRDPANAKALADKVGAKVHSGNNLGMITPM
jgi:predicted dehydrogenase